MQHFYATNMTKTWTITLFVIIALLFIAGFIYIRSTPNKYFDYSQSNPTNNLLK